MVLRNIFYLFTIQAFRLLLPLAILSVLTSVLTSNQYGVYIYTLASAAWLGVFVEYGFSVSATRSIASSEFESGVRLTIVQTESARWILVALTMIYLIWAIYFSEVFSSYYEWAICSWLLGIVNGMAPVYYYQAKSLLRLVAFLEIMGGAVIFTSVWFCVRVEEDFTSLIAILLMVRIIILVTLNHRMRAIYGLYFFETMNIRMGVMALKDGWKIFLVQCAASLYTSFNVMLLGGFSTAYSVAVYGSSERMIRAGLSFIAQATSAIYPHLNSIKKKTPEKLSQWRKLALMGLFAGAVFCIPLIWNLAPLISDLLFHDKMPEIVNVLRIMAFIIPAIAISNVLAFHYLAVDHQEHIINWVVFVAVPINLVLGSALSQEYGARGMASAWLAVEWFVAIALAVLIFCRKKSIE
jgi:PST family polysaccharide transporter